MKAAQAQHHWGECKVQRISLAFPFIQDSLREIQGGVTSNVNLVDDLRTSNEAATFM